MFMNSVSLSVRQFVSLRLSMSVCLSVYGSLSKNGAILVPDVFFANALCEVGFSMYNIIIRGALLEPHAI